MSRQIELQYIELTFIPAGNDQKISTGNDLKHVANVSGMGG